MAAAPRGHNSSDTTTPTIAPTTTSSTRIRPTCQPLGLMMLKMISTIIVNIAWPATNDATSGTYAEPKATTGSANHSTTGSTPINSMNTMPSRKPSVVPTTARTTRVPVVSALLRSTDIAPRTTQKPCWTGKTWVTVTASARPRPVRRLLRTTTALVARKPPGSERECLGLREQPLGRAGLGQPATETRAHTGRASAAAAMPMIRPVVPTQPETVLRVSSFRPTPMAVASLRLAEDLDDVVAVAALGDQPLHGQRGGQLVRGGRRGRPPAAC